MKALTLNSLEKKTEAYDCIRLGVRNNLRSPVCANFILFFFELATYYKEIGKVGTFMV